MNISKVFSFSLLRGTQHKVLHLALHVSFLISYVYVFPSFIPVELINSAYHLISCTPMKQ